MTIVISTTDTAGCEVMMRWSLGRWPGVKSRVSPSTRARTRSVVQGMSCLDGREPASISTIT
jgi:hypothetical protein